MRIEFNEVYNLYSYMFSIVLTIAAYCLMVRRLL